MRYTALAVLTGCYPVFAHPTRVESGAKLSSFTSFALVSDSGREDGRRNLLFVPSIDFEASLGIRDTSRSDGPGLRLAASGGLSGWSGSVYMEAPRDRFGPVDAGLGFTAYGGAGPLWSTYVQFGRRESDEMSWFLRNGVAFDARTDSAESAVLWVPTVGIVRHRLYREATIFLSAIVGRQLLYQGPCFFTCSGPAIRTLAMVGASMSFTILR